MSTLNASKKDGEEQHHGCPTGQATTIMCNMNLIVRTDLLIID